MTVPGGWRGLHIIQPLGADRAVLVAADTSSGSRRLVMVERVIGASLVPAARAELLRRGLALKALEHPKVVRVRDVLERDGDVVVLSDYVDGEWLAALLQMQPRPPLEIMLRLLVDVLEGLAALHDLRDEHDRPIGFVHGAIAPDTVLVADDGVAEIARTCRLPRPGSNERYVPPELRRGDVAPDPRFDIFGAGAILRDILAGASGEAKWAAPLTEVASRACAVNPLDRWSSAPAMATPVRRIVGVRLATVSVVAAFLRKNFGAAIRARRAAFESARDSAPPSSGEPISLSSSDIVLEPFSPTVSAPPPALKKDAAPGRVSLAKKPILVLAAPEEQVARMEARAPAKAIQPGVTPPPGKTTRPGIPPPPAKTTPIGVVAPSVDSAPIEPAPPLALPQRAPPLPGSPMRSPTPVPSSVRGVVPAPAPAIGPEDRDPVAAYRRQLPTFPTIEEQPPALNRTAPIALVVAGAMILTFGLGWWLGRSSMAPAPAVGPATSSPSVASLAASSTSTTPWPAPVVSSSPSSPASSAAPPSASPGAVASSPTSSSPPLTSPSAAAPSPPPAAPARPAVRATPARGYVPSEL